MIDGELYMIGIKLKYFFCYSMDDTRFKTSDNGVLQTRKIFQREADEGVEC
jgi:hypothetical protein